MYPDKFRGSRRSWGAGRQLLSPRQKVWEEMPDLLESSPLRHYQLSALSASAPCPWSRSVFDLEWGVLSVCFLNDHRRLSKSDAFCPCPPLSLLHVTSLPAFPLESSWRQPAQINTYRGPSMNPSPSKLLAILLS